MKKMSFLVVLFVAANATAQPDTTLAIGECATCDTVYKHKKQLPDGSLMIRKVKCYYADAKGNRTDEVYAVVHFRNGLKNGSERGYYREQEQLYITLFKKPFRKQPSDFVLFINESFLGIAPLSDRYTGHWKKGVKNGSWCYYDTMQKTICDTFYTADGKPDTLYDGYMSSNFDLTINGNGQTRKSGKGDTLWLWNVENNQLEGDFFMFDKHHRIRQQYTYHKGRLLSEKRFRKGSLRREEVYDKGGIPTEIFRYRKNGELISHKIPGPSYSYKSARYIDAGMP